MPTANSIKTISLDEVLKGMRSFLRYLLGSVRMILLIVLCTTLLAVGYYFVQKPSYEGNVTFILEEKSGGIPGGLSGLASQVGIDIGSLSGGSEIFSGDNILDILKSETIIERALLSKIDSSKGANSPTLADLFYDISGFKKKWSGKQPELAGLSYSRLGVNSAHSLLQDSALHIFYDRIFHKYVTTERLDKKGSIITISTLSVNQTFSKLLSERLLAETKKYYINIKTSVAADNVARLERRADSLQQILTSKSYQSASAQILDANEAFRTAAVPGEISQRDKMVNYAIYTEVMKNLEASRMSLANQTPVIQLLDDSKYPLVDQRKSFILLFLGGIIAGLAVSLILCFVLYPGGREV